MTQYYYILDALETHFTNDSNINQVSKGDIFRIDLNKQSIYAIAHIMIGQAQPLNGAVQFSIQIILADLVDISKDESSDLIQQNDNEVDALNTMLVSGLACVESAKRGDLWSDLVELVGQPTLEPFVERFENNLAGWTLSMEVLVPNSISVC